jgi:hypothetical protein
VQSLEVSILFRPALHTRSLGEAVEKNNEEKITSTPKITSTHLEPRFTDNQDPFYKDHKNKWQP